MAIKDRTTLKSESNSRFQTGQPNNITAAKHRAQAADFIDSHEHVLEGAKNLTDQADITFAAAKGSMYNMDPQVTARTSFTVSSTGALLGAVAWVRHNHTSAPSLPDSAVDIASFSTLYSPGVDNYIKCQVVSLSPFRFTVQIVNRSLSNSSPSGAQIFSGPDSPIPEIGNEFDMYFQVDNPPGVGEPIFYRKIGSSWGAGTSLVGAQGPAGNDGAAGAQGPAGPQGSNYGVQAAPNLAPFITFGTNFTQHGELTSPLTDLTFLIDFAAPAATDGASVLLWLKTASKPQFVSNQKMILIEASEFLESWQADQVHKVVLTLKIVGDTYHVLATLQDKGKIYTSVGTGGAAKMYEDVDAWSLSGAQIFGRGSSIRSTTVSVNNTYQVTAQENGSVGINQIASYVFGIPVSPNDRSNIGLGHASDSSPSDGQYAINYLGAYFFRHKTNPTTGPYTFQEGVDEWFIDILQSGQTCTVEFGKWVGGVKANDRQVLVTINETDRLDNLFFRQSQRQSVINEISNVRRRIE